jgi:DNA/RNA-binding domain of Phe-tRNA-synthetase-like protein
VEMKKFVVKDDFWELFPDAKIGIVLCNDIDNTVVNKEFYQEMIANAEREALKHLKNEEFSSNEVIKVWREAFQKYKTKKGARSSVEALLKRVSNGNHLGTINPLVDIYNSISLKYALPCGGEDLDTFAGDIRLTKANGNEKFVTLGSDENAPPVAGEIIYKDDQGAICRGWNWRESVRTMLTEKTKNAFLCVELVDERRASEFEDALHELAQSVKENIGGTCKITIIDVDNKEMIIM